MTRMFVYNLLYDILPLMDLSFSKRILEVVESDIKSDLGDILTFLESLGKVV